MRGVEFATAFTAGIDRHWPDLFAERPGLALAATGSYGRGELCPGSDIDAWLIGRKRVDPKVADACWYPIWDAGLPLGHAVRTLKEVSQSVEEDLETLTAGLDLRHLAGDPSVTAEARAKALAVAIRRKDTLIATLQEQVLLRDNLAIAEMLEPDLKEGGGGLRDLDAIRWLELILVGAGSGTLEQLGYLSAEDAQVLNHSRKVLIDSRVALHRTTGSKSNILALQDQDAVGALIDQSADGLMRIITDAARRISWIVREVFQRATTPPVPAQADIALSDSIVVHGEAIAIRDGIAIDARAILEAAAFAAERGLPIDRTTLRNIAATTDQCSMWNDEMRELFLRLLRSGRFMVDVVEALDHVGVFARFLPEWDRVRSLPQRNAYHRFTVDRHLLETIAEAAVIVEAEAARGQPLADRDRDLLLMGALLHDLAKGQPEDHSVLGSELARTLAARMGFDEVAGTTLSFLVRQHLLLADTAVRRDLDDPTTIETVGSIAGDPERLYLLLLLTLADSKATGPAAWSQSKITLMRSLAQRTENWLLDGRTPDRSVRDELLDRYAALIHPGEVHVQWQEGDENNWECVIAAPDQRGLLAACAGALASIGFEILTASGYGVDHGMALECFSGRDQFDRLATPEGREAAGSAIISAIAGTLDTHSAMAKHIARYRKGTSDVVVTIDQDASQVATVVEVSADDVPGLLAVVAGVFSDFELDVDIAKVATFGSRVVDVFYVRDARGKVQDRYVLERLRATLHARLTSMYGLLH